MVKLVKYQAGQSIPDVDYVLEKTDKLFDIINILTPKFQGRWEFVLIDPTIKVVKTILEDQMLPDWIDIYIYTSQKKIDELVLEYPNLMPKKVSRKEMFDELIAELHCIIDKRAYQAIFQALGDNPEECRKVLTKLDAEATNGRITLKQVQHTINYTKRIYASDVLVAFLIQDRRRWDHYYKLLDTLGPTVMYYALKKQVKKLLLSKEDYLQNKDVKLYVVKRVDAPCICYAYCIFANTNNPNQLYNAMYAIDNRCADQLELIQQYNI